MRHMRVRVNDPSLVPDLLAFLQRGGLIVAPEGVDTVNVLVPHALNDLPDHDADRLRIVGELRSWLAGHRGAQVDLLQGDPPLLGVS
jgi:hypothetical protein